MGVGNKKWAWPIKMRVVIIMAKSIGLAFLAHTPYHRSLVFNAPPSSNSPATQKNGVTFYALTRAPQSQTCSYYAVTSYYVTHDTVNGHVSVSQ